MKHLTILCAAFFIISISYSQNKELKIEDLANTSIYPDRLPQLQWKNNKGEFTYVKNDAIIHGNINSDQRDTLLKIADLNKILATNKFAAIKRIPQFSWENDQNMQFIVDENLINYQYQSNTIKILNNYTIAKETTKKAENIDIEQKTKKIAYTLDNNLFISDKGEKTQITSDTNNEVVYGIAVHRNEWGINKGTFWSPDGSQLAFYRMDQSMVTDYPIVHVANVENRIAEVEMIKYPMAGMKSHEVTIGVYNLVSKKTIYLQTGEPKDQFLTSVTWSPDQKYIYVPILNRAQNHLKINKYNAENGSFVKTLFEEKNDKWVEPEHGLFFINNNPSQFLWYSKRDGFNHLYLYNSDGELIKQVSKGNFDLNEIVGLSPDGSIIYVEAANPTPIDLNVFAINIEKGSIIKITQGSGIHHVVPNSDYRYFIDQYSNIDLPLKIQIVDNKGKINKSIQISDNPLKDFKLGLTKIFTLKASDGSDLYCRIIKPANFDSTKKYPVFYYVYGGPHTQLVKNSWLGSSDLFMQSLASRGYIVFTLDNHGTPNRGLQFEQAIHRQVGTIEMDDQMKGIKYLKSLAYVDTNRMGIQGWSYGGFMTISLMQKHPGIFKAAIAGGPVIDWKLYEIMYGERYMDTPEENPNGYNNNCLLNSIDQLSGRLMVIHGTIDPTVVWQNSLLYLKESITKGKLVDYFVYPEYEHNVRGMDRLHLYRKIEDYLNQNLK